MLIHVNRWTLVHSFRRLGGLGQMASQHGREQLRWTGSTETSRSVLFRIGSQGLLLAVHAALSSLPSGAT